MGDVIDAIMLGYVFDDFGTPFHAKVDVEVGHADAFGIEKSLEEQRKRQRIEVGNRHRIGDERSRTRTTPWAYGDIVHLCPMDKIPNDEEVSGKVHLRDDVDFSLESLPIDFFIDGFARCFERFESFGESVSRDFFKILVYARMRIGNFVRF